MSLYSYMQYLKSRPGAASESVRRVKTIKVETIGCHPLLRTSGTVKEGSEAENFLLQMKKFRPPAVITCFIQIIFNNQNKK